MALQLLQDLTTCAALVRYAADQIHPLRRAAGRESRLRPAQANTSTGVPGLVREFLGAQVEIQDHALCVRGTGFRRQ